MNTYKLPDFITNKNFNNERVYFIAMQKERLQKLFLQSSYQSIVKLFEENEELSIIRLEVYEQYDSGGHYFNLGVEVIANNPCDYILGDEARYVIEDKFNNSALCRIKAIGGLSLIRNNLVTFKSLARVLFPRESDVEIYLDVLSKGDKNILPADYITAENMNNEVRNSIRKSLSHVQDLERQIAILSIWKLFNAPCLNSLEVKVTKDGGCLYPRVTIDSYNGDLDILEYEENIRCSIEGVLKERMLASIYDAPPIKIDRGNCIKKLTEILFDENKNGDDFIIAFNKDELEINIKNKEDAIFAKKCKI